MPQDIINLYMNRLRDLGGREDHIGRYYVATTDEELLSLEQHLIDGGAGLSLHDPVLALYRDWKDAMGTEKWAEVWARNEALGDADRNWLVSEEMSSVATLL